MFTLDIAAFVVIGPFWIMAAALLGAIASHPGAPETTGQTLTRTSAVSVGPPAARGTLPRPPIK